MVMVIIRKDRTLTEYQNPANNSGSVLEQTSIEQFFYSTEDRRVHYTSKT